MSLRGRMKQGQLARIGLFMAIAAMFGKDEMNDVAERRKRWGHHGHARGFGYKGGTGTDRAGFKLLKKMSRRPRSAARLVGRKVTRLALKTGQASFHNRGARAEMKRQHQIAGTHAYW